MLRSRSVIEITLCMANISDQHVLRSGKCFVIFVVTLKQLVATGVAGLKRQLAISYDTQFASTILRHGGIPQLPLRLCRDLESK